MNGYTGKILRVNLTSGRITRLDTREYSPWGGGHGLGSAIFFDLVKDKTIEGLDPRNVITIMTSPLTGTLIPGAASRTEMQGIGVQSYPIGWFTRSNVGGRFGPMLKFAGWDGIVIEGRAEKPVWLDLRNDEVRIEDARPLWGLDTWETQARIWKIVCGESFGDWNEVAGSEADGRTTQRPAVLAIGPAGENLARVGAVIHDAGNAAGQGGFGAVWGSKNLKAISVIGTGSVEVSDPREVLNARLWAKRNYGLNVDDPAALDQLLETSVHPRGTAVSPGSMPAPIVFWQWPRQSRPQACMGCPVGCRTRNQSGLGNESSCGESGVYAMYDLQKHSGLLAKAMSKLVGGMLAGLPLDPVLLLKGKQTDAAFRATDLLQKYGINAFEFLLGLLYLRSLYQMKKLGPGREIATDLPFDKLGEEELAEKLFHAVAYREAGLGDDLAEGFYRAAKKWGRLEEDLNSGLLRFAYWGLPDHYDPRFQLEWGYGSILGDRDINEHGFVALFMIGTLSQLLRKEPIVTAEEAAYLFTSRMAPFQGDLRMLDYSTENMYSESMVKLVAWHRRYTRFWKQSMLFCDLLFPDFINPAVPDKRGMLGEGEPRFFKAVTGSNLSFGDGIELGRKIWNLDNAIWTLQGRHRDLARFSPYIYQTPFNKPAYLPGLKNGKWEYLSVRGRSIDEKKFEEWKTRYYRFEGWDPTTGWPRARTLESLGLKSAADELKAAGRIGREET
ncbi:MAG: hypothetical protein A2V67_01000 [Deltaproteobacteria bacterium RBG_13_61_14]|nr:MAG: hypothetical protein A2V67_01000 [Deltaproteobacteria bacterium RBG_13_61_14]